MSHHALGLMEIELAGQTVKLSPTFEAMLAIEEKAEKGCATLAVEIQAGNIGIKTASAIIYGGLIGAGQSMKIDGQTRAPTFYEVGKMVQAEGLYKFLKPAGEFLSECLSGSFSSEEEEPAGEAMGVAR